MSRPLHEQGARALAAAVSTGARTAAEITETFLARAAGDTCGAFIELWPERARRRAADIDRARAAGSPLGPLAGVPIAVKDNFVLAGEATGCASHILDGFRSPYTATVLERLEQAGAVFLGRTNMDEFAMGSSTAHSRHGPTRNPFAPDRSPGGSSGGSAVAVAARLCPLALGSDTGGSVRQPAALCGIPGLKPTYGRIPRHGLVAYASSLDTVAWFGRDPEDLALALQVSSGPDSRDATALDDPPPAGPETLAQPIDGLRIGVPDQVFAEGLDPAVGQAVRSALGTLEERGAALVPVSLPHLHHGVAAYYLIACAEASSNLARFDGVRYGKRQPAADLAGLYRSSRSAGFGSEVQLRILLGTFCLRSGYYDDWYLKAAKVRTLVQRDFAAAFKQCDLVATPTTPTPAFTPDDLVRDPLAEYLCDVFTVPANLAGLPAVSVPANGEGLPVGLQLIGPRAGEDLCLRAAHHLLAASGHHLRCPS